jgi:hypothetical protein
LPHYLKELLPCTSCKVGYNSRKVISLLVLVLLLPALLSFSKGLQNYPILSLLPNKKGKIFSYFFSSFTFPLEGLQTYLPLLSFPNLTLTFFQFFCCLYLTFLTLTIPPPLSPAFSPCSFYFSKTYFNFLIKLLTINQTFSKINLMSPLCYLS